MNDDKTVAWIGLIGMLILIYSILFFDPQSMLGSITGLIGIILALFPIFYLYMGRKNMKGGKD